MLSTHHPRHHLPDREARRQPWAFDAIECDQACDGVLARPMNREICGRLAGARKLRAHARIAGVECILRQAWPVTADLTLEGGAPRAIGILESVVDALYPFDVRAELGTPAVSSVKCTPSPPPSARDRSAVRTAAWSEERSNDLSRSMSAAPCIQRDSSAAAPRSTRQAPQQ